jgi:hypothetical protein
MMTRVFHSSLYPRIGDRSGSRTMQVLDTSFNLVDTILLFEFVLIDDRTNNYPISMAILFEKLN